MKTVVLMSVFALLLACKKEEKATTASFVFNEPLAGDTIQSYNSLHVDGSVSADGNMYGYTVRLRNNNTNSIVYEKSYDSKSKAYNFHEHWLNSVTDTALITVQVAVKLDENGTVQYGEASALCLP